MSAIANAILAGDGDGPTDEHGQATGANPWFGLGHGPIGFGVPSSRREVRSVLRAEALPSRFTNEEAAAFEGLPS